MHRFFVEPQRLAGERVTLEDDVLHHLARVLRLTPGAEVELLDGRGLICRCRVESLEGRQAWARVLSRRWQQDTAFPVRLLQGLPKGDKMDLVLQKGTELGIGAFVPVLAARSIPALKTEREAKRLQRWRRIAQEAARQCRRPQLPEVHSPQPLATALNDSPDGLRLMLWEAERRPLAAVLPAERPPAATLLVGPEGGFTGEEAQAATAAGFVTVGLGPRILRSETAGFTLTAVLQYLYGDLGSDAPSQEGDES